ncbi:MAG TPA: putative sugar nucleotidyl transferase [Gemmatimonadaceae bacterium]
MTLVFVDDDVARAFEPFALTRPCCELRAGALLVRQRWEVATGEATLGFVGSPLLADFDEPGAAAPLAGTIPAGSIVINARCAVALTGFPLEADAWRCGDRLAAARLRADTDADTLRAANGDFADFAGSDAIQVEGRWLDHVWDLIRLLPDLLLADVPMLAEPHQLESTTDLTVLGAHSALVEQGAVIEPQVVIDVQAGPVLVRRGATVSSFTRLVGPCIIGEGTIVNGGRIATSSIGEHCRVHGEVSHSVFTAYANKGHDGFIGHSVLGRWVNLGAGTVNSNLKNNYSDVSLWTPRGVERTGMQFLGAFLGDHARTAIGTRLTTGAVVGAGANVLGSGVTPRYVPPFAWGLEGNEVWDLDAFLDTAARAMQRRNVTLTGRGKRQLTAAWQSAVKHP